MRAAPTSAGKPAHDERNDPKLNTTILNPHIAAALASDHQNALISESRRSAILARLTDKPGMFEGLRHTLGALMVRAGQRVAGRRTASALVRQPAL